MSRDNSSVGKGESVQRAERVAIPQHCTETERWQLILVASKADKAANEKVNVLRDELSFLIFFNKYHPKMTLLNAPGVFYNTENQNPKQQ